MKMVIVGAGASYDSIILGNTPLSDSQGRWRPPINGGLFGFNTEFDEILKKYPGALSFRSDISLCPDIEEYFQNKYDLSQGPGGETLQLQILNVQFYLQDLFYSISHEYIDFGTSNYDILVSQAYEYYLRSKEEVLFVSFNYDTLLEKSIENICKVRFDTIQDYMKSPLKVFKPHGSCNWVRTIADLDRNQITSMKKNGFAKVLYSSSDITKTLKHIDNLNKNIGILQTSLAEIENNPQSNLVCVPQILIPLQSKDEFIMPDFHLKELGSLLEKVNEIFIIGWKANELHFNKLLKEKLKTQNIKVLYVCANDESIPAKFSTLKSDFIYTRFFRESIYNNLRYNAGTFSAFSLEYRNYEQFQFFKT